MLETSRPNPRFKSLTPKDPQYKSYLMGEFSDTDRAIPQPSLNAHSVNEIVTFEIVPKNQLEKASSMQKIRVLLKPETWLTVLVPLIVIANLETGKVAGVSFQLAVVLLLLMTFANWQTDLADHLEGWDRLQGAYPKSALQKGWMTGVQLKKGSFFVLGLAFLFGVSLILKQPWVLVPYTLAVLSLLLLLPRWWRRTLVPGLSTVLIFLLTGPLLTIGIDLTFDGKFSLSSFFIGAAWGIWMSFARQQKIYTKQWHFYQKNSAYFFLGLGFDKSKALMRLLIPTVPGAMILMSLFISGGSAWFFPLLVVHSAFVFLELQANEKVQSSIGSSLLNLQMLFQWHHYVLSLVMIMGSMVWKTAF